MAHECVNNFSIGHRRRPIAPRCEFWKLRARTNYEKTDPIPDAHRLTPSLLGVALVFFGCWITEIVVPALKGGNFDQLYDLHRVRYLDTTLACIAIAFVWVSTAVFQHARKLIYTAR